MLGKLNARVGIDDRRKIDAHLEAVRSLERRVLAGGGSCSVPTDRDFSYPSLFDNDSFPRMSRQMIEQLVLSLACDLTRVASLLWIDRPLYVAWADGEPSRHRALGRIRFTHGAGDDRDHAVVL